ncbi:ABC transporter ATP-binding protein [Marinomonas sp. 2405UD68-3]|uniref:ABC transporter ATP-binding protein n=1 Tax=Marinomonas sp. 2405UD68-3 TaxID=3391835 RepID=UPI0039C93BCE
MNHITIAVEALSVYAGATQLLGPITFSLPTGRSLVIMGETGAGKSLLAQAILGTLPDGLHSTGTIHLNGQRIDQLSPQERSRFWGRDVAILPQEPWRALDPLMYAAAQVQESYRFVAGLTRSNAAAATQSDFNALELHGNERRLPRTLSGGMAQRVAFAAATAADAPILIADEPTKGLDTQRSAKIISLLTEKPNQGGALITITHEASVARQLGGDILVLKSGTLIESGSTTEVLNNPSEDYTQQLLNAEPRAWPKQASSSRGDLLLNAENLSIYRGGKCLLEDFSLELYANERIAITGPSGVGKTSLLDVLAGINQPEKGRVTRNSSVIQTGIQKLYQDPPAAFPNKVSLEKSLRDVARLHSVDWSVVLEYLSELGIHPSLMDRRPDAVSGGELQRISIARALTANPTVLLADEPTSRLDPITQRETLAMIADIASERGIAVLLVTHDLDIAEKWADRHYTLHSPL